MTEGGGGAIPPRPLTQGQIFSGARASMRRSPAASFGLAAPVAAVAGLGSAISALRVTDMQAHPASTAGGFATGASKIFLSFALSLLLSGLLAPVVTRSVQGLKTSLRQAWRLAWPGLPALLGATGLLLVMSSVIVIPYGLVLPTADRTHAAVAVAVAIVTGIATAVAEIAGWVLVSLTAIAVVVEQAGPVEAIRGSWRLVWPRRKRVLGNLTVTALASYAALAVVALPLVAVHVIVTSVARPLTPVLTDALDGLSVMVAGTITLPFVAGAIAMVYYDLRVQREGADVVLSATAVAR